MITQDCVLHGGERGSEGSPLMWNPVTRSCISAAERHELRQPFKGGRKHLQNLLMGPYICIHFTQSLFILKKSISLLQMANCKKPREHSSTPPAVIAITHLRAAETCYAGTRTQGRGPLLLHQNSRGLPGHTFYWVSGTGCAEQEHGLGGPHSMKGTQVQVKPGVHAGLKGWSKELENARKTVPEK